MNQPIKPGWKTSEFWLSTITTLGGILTASGVFAGSEQTINTVVQVAGVLVSAIVPIFYVGLRTELKQKGS